MNFSTVGLTALQGRIDVFLIEHPRLLFIYFQCLLELRPQH